MATEIIKYLDSAGKAWDTAIDADTSTAKLTNKEAVEKFISENYAKATSNGRKSPAAKAAANAIYKWLGNQNVVVTLEA